jgi:hypothetical protein
MNAKCQFLLILVTGGCNNENNKKETKVGQLELCWDMGKLK